jgi:hypothetical protein
MVSTKVSKVAAEKEVAPVAPPIKYDTKISSFGFIIEGEHTYLSVKTGISVVNYAVTIDFNITEWETLYEKLTNAFKTFEKNGAFADATVKSEYISLANTGYLSLKEANDNIIHIMAYKLSSKAVPESTCLISLGSINKLEIERIFLHLEKSLSHIKATWVPADLRNDLDKRQVIMEFLTIFNSGLEELSGTSQNILAILEMLSENTMPIFALGPKRSCHVGTTTEGEQYRIISCGGNTNGYTCRTEVIQPLGLMEVNMIHPVPYAGLQVINTNDTHILVKETSTSTVKLMFCTHRTLSHPICREVHMDTNCAQAIGKQLTDRIIAACTFVHNSNHEAYQLLAGGGVMIYAADRIVANAQVIANKAPVVVYSAGAIEVTRNTEQYSIYPETKATVTTVIASSITQADLEKLKNKMYWDELKASQTSEDYIDYSIILFELLSLPFLIYGFIRSWRMSKAKKTADGKAIYQRNKALLPLIPKQRQPKPGRGQ